MQARRYPFNLLLNLQLVSFLCYRGSKKSATLHKLSALQDVSTISVLYLLSVVALGGIETSGITGTTLCVVNNNLLVKKVMRHTCSWNFSDMSVVIRLVLPTFAGTS